jgi:hypothetical protein
MKRIHLVTAVLVFLFIFGSKETKLAAQERRNVHGELVDFSNRAITTDCCLWNKRRIDSIMNNAPIIFEGRMIKGEGGLFYNSYLFEIGKVYRGGERLKSGSIEIISSYSDGISPIALTPASFTSGWHIIFAKEINSITVHTCDRSGSNVNVFNIDTLGVFDANNSIKLELFYVEQSYSTGGQHAIPSSYFAEIPEVTLSNETLIIGGISHYSGFSLNFITQKAVRDFLAIYGLSPISVPKADTVKSLCFREIKEALERQVIDGMRQEVKSDAEYRLWQEESSRRHYNTLLENLWKLDSVSGKKSTRKKEIEDAMNEYENASDSMRNQMRYELMIKQKQYLDSISNAPERKGTGQHKSGNAKLTLSINNARVTTSAGDNFMEFDVMLRANQAKNNFLKYNKPTKHIV